MVLGRTLTKHTPMSIEQGQIGHSEADLMVGNGHELKTGQGVGHNKAHLWAANKSGQGTDQEEVSYQDHERGQPNRNSLAVNSTMSELVVRQQTVAGKPVQQEE